MVEQRYEAVRAVVAAVEHVRDVPGAEPVLGVGLEDDPDDEGLRLVDDQAAGGGVGLVAERPAAAL